MVSTPLIQLHAVHVKQSLLCNKRKNPRNSRKKIPKSGHSENTWKSAYLLVLLKTTMGLLES